MTVHSDSHGRRPTIRDVAERAGVSKSLVSLVMRGEPMVRDDKRRRVLQAAEELGYRKNIAAQSLTRARSHTIGVLVADLHNPLLVDIVETAGEVLEDAGYSVLLTSATAPPRPAAVPRIDVRAVSALRDLRVEALLVVGSVPDRATLADVMGDIPMVVAAAGADKLHADVVRNDDHLGMRLIVDHLVAEGHRKIAHLGGLGGDVAQERLEGYCAAMAHHGLADEIATAEAGFSEDSGYRAAARMLRRPGDVTAMTAVNDLAAVGALSAAADAGLNVPADLALTGYDDIFVSAIRQVSLTSVDPDSSTIGVLAGRRLLERIEAPDTAPREHLLAPRLMARSSSGVPQGQLDRPGGIADAPADVKTVVTPPERHTRSTAP